MMPKKALNQLIKRLNMEKPQSENDNIKLLGNEQAGNIYLLADKAPYTQQYPPVKKATGNRLDSTKLLDQGQLDNTYLLTGEIHYPPKCPLSKKILRNRFEIVNLLGSGGSGNTYLAIDLDLPGKPYCVVKHFQPKDSNPAVLPIAESLFTREAEVLYQLGNEHNQIPRLFAHFNENGDFYLVQEFIDGYDLTQELVPGKPLNENVVFQLLKDILEVLVFVHQHNIIHRDIKPQNLMRRYSDQKIVLIDFGSIKKIGALGASATIAVGTPGYMPSEQAKGRPKLCSDLYAVGMIGIQALTGLMPNQLQEDPNTGEIIWRNQVYVSDALADVLDTMVHERYSKRYQSATEALQALILAMELSDDYEAGGINTSHNSTLLVPYKNLILFLGIGFGIITSAVIIVLIYTFFNVSTPPQNQPTQSNRFTEKNGKLRLDQVEVCNNNCTSY